MCLVADALRIRPGRCDEEKERLGSRIPQTLGHDIEELSVRLGMELIEDDPGYIEPVLAVGIRRKHLVKAVHRVVDDPLLRCQDLGPSC